ncbi:MAG: NUDIX domain-containing protein [Candidatus Dependentiae bacterium]|nr:NUDIX domain-containing protein [Candidatus Dependentiae bacterium]
MEIGTGGDPIASMLEKMSATARTTLIASDIDENILKALPVRHPGLKKYIGAQVGPCLKLQQLNAIDMSSFQDASLDGINASSVLHEIISYAGGFEGMEKFFGEVFRTLKPSGILVYRDPECVTDKNMVVSVRLKSKTMSLFAHVFLYKFLDHKRSGLARAGRKMSLYSTDDVRFVFYKKNECEPVRLTYQEYLSVPSYDIDFSRQYSLTLPCGLYRELARHYITYLHDCNPLVFVRSIPVIGSNLYTTSYLAHSTASLFNNFLVKSNGQICDGKINHVVKNALDQEINSNSQVLEFGIPLHFSSRIKESQLRSLLRKYDFDPGHHIIALNNGDCLVDYRVFGMLYDDINQLFDKFNGVVDKKDITHAQWLKREGEEFYFYHSADELIAKVLSLTLAAAQQKNQGGDLYVLCPLSENHNKFVDRLCYTEVLNNSLEVRDALGYSITVKDGKRVVHFCKMLLKDAIAVCEKIIEEGPMEYPRVREWVDGAKKYYAAWESSHADELLDVVDSNDQVIGQQLRSKVYADKTSNFRVVNAFVMNDKGQLWIPRRAANKRLFPLCFDASMGGHVSAGETYEQAFSRELMEELRIDANSSSYECLGSLNPQKHGTSAFMRVYLLRTNKAPQYNTDDFTESFWLKPSEVLERLAAGDKSKDDLPVIIRQLFL